MKILDRLKNLMPWVKAAKRKKLETAAAYLLAEYRKTVGVQGSKLDRSRPGEPPRRQTGAFQASLQVHVEDWGLSLGSTNGKLARWLEEGTKKMKPRPHREPTLDRCRSRLLAILNG